MKDTLKYVVAPGMLLVLILSGLNLFRYQRELEFSRTIYTNEVAETRSVINRRIQSAVIAVESLRAFFVSSTNVTKEEFDLFSSVLTKNVNSGSIALSITAEWIDAQNKITYAYPMNEENSKIIGLDVNRYPNRLSSITKAKMTRSAVISDPVILVQGYPGFLIYSPIFKGDKYLGEALVVVRLKNLLAPVLGNTAIYEKNKYIQAGDFILPFNEDAIFNTKGERIVNPQGDTVQDPSAREYMAITTGAPSEDIVFVDKTWQLKGTSTYVVETYKKMAIYISLSLLFATLVITFLFILEKRRKQLASELARINALVSSVGDGLVICDKKGIITFTNKIAEEISGYSAEESVGKSYYDVWHLLDKDGVALPIEERFFYRAMIKKEMVVIPLGSHFSILRKDGIRLPIASHVIPVLVDGEVEGAMASFRDVTKESEVDRMKSEFISLASHQLKTPITAVSWNLEMLLDGEQGPLTPEQKETLEDMYASSKNMLELVGGFLEITKMESGNFSFEKGDVDLLQVSESLLEELRKPIADKKLTIMKRYGTAVSHIDIGTKAARAILQNLLTNAVKYTPEGGVVEIGIEEKAGGILIYVKDTGYGIPEKEKSRIFSKLFRAGNVREVEPSGTGLGLYILKSLVDSLGGKVWFESKEGLGTTFYVQLRK